ncbi:MAG: sigma factor-like helix-turn-helix DNA-binding protein [Acidimicrobiales bacterium]
MTEDPAVEEVLSALGPEERAIVRSRLALDRPGSPAVRTLQETAVRFGVAQHSIRELEARVLRDIRLRSRPRD